MKPHLHSLPHPLLLSPSKGLGPCADEEQSIIALQAIGKATSPYSRTLVSVISGKAMLSLLPFLLPFLLQLPSRGYSALYLYHPKTHARDKENTRFSYSKNLARKQDCLYQGQARPSCPPCKGCLFQGQCHSSGGTSLGTVMGMRGSKSP